MRNHSQRYLAVLPLLFAARIFAADANEALLAAAERGDVAAAQEALGQGAAIDTRDPRGWTPLIIASKAGQLDLMKSLVDHGADVNARSTSDAGSTVLSFGTETDNPAVLDFLLAHGAKVNARSRNGATALYSAGIHHKVKATEFLISKGANVNQLAMISQSGISFSPFMGAASLDDVDTTTIMLDHGASLEKRSNSGATTLMRATAIGAVSTVKLIIARGANVNATDTKGQTALFYAAENNRIENIRILLAAGADPSVRASASEEDPDAKDFDAADLAQRNGFAQAAAMIRSHQTGTKTASP